MNKLIKNHFFPKLSSLSGIDLVMKTIKQAKSILPGRNKQHIKETFIEACQRLDVSNEQVEIIAYQKKIEARIYAVAAIMMPIFSSLMMPPVLLSYFVCLSATMALTMCWFSCAWRLWQVESRYLGTAKEFVKTYGWFINCI